MLWNAGLKFVVEIYPACESSKPVGSSIAACVQTSLKVLLLPATFVSGILAPKEPPAFSNFVASSVFPVSFK